MDLPERKAGLGIRGEAQGITGVILGVTQVEQSPPYSPPLSLLKSPPHLEKAAPRGHNSPGAPRACCEEQRSQEARQSSKAGGGGTSDGLVFPAPICLLFPVLLIHTWPLSLHDQEQRKEGHPSDPSSSTCCIHGKGLM